MREFIDRFSAIGTLHRVPLDSARAQWCVPGFSIADSLDTAIMRPSGTPMSGRSLHRFKPRLQAALRPMVNGIGKRGITANQITFGTTAISVALGFAIFIGHGARLPFLLIPVWLAFRMALNATDGMLAREFAQKTPLGAYLNELGDVISDAALYLPFGLIAPFSFTGMAIVVLLSALTEYAGALGPMIGVSRRYDGPLGKSDRALVAGVFASWIGVDAALPDWLHWLVPVISALLIWTIVNRVRAGIAEARLADSIR